MALAPARLGFTEGKAYDYGPVRDGEHAEHSFTLTNDGEFPASTLAALPLTFPFSFKGGNYPGEGGSCGTELAAGASCTLVTTFSPAEPGQVIGTLALDYVDGVASRQVSLAIAGEKGIVARLSLETSEPWDFGLQAVGVTRVQTLRIRNTGGMDATGLSASELSAPFSYLGESYPGSGGTCGTQLAQGDSCTVVVAFSPRETKLTKQLLHLSYNDGLSSGTMTCLLVGLGAMPAELDAAGPLDFGKVPMGGMAEASLMLLNRGGVPATHFLPQQLPLPFSYKGGSFPGAGGTCGNLVLEPEPCTLVLTYAPTTLEAHPILLALTYFDGKEHRILQVPVTGQGVRPAILAYEDGVRAVAFGSWGVGRKADRIVWVSNRGGVAATQIVNAQFPPPFGFKGGEFPGLGGTCGRHIEPEERCRLVFDFSPSSPGMASTTLGLSYHNGLSNWVLNKALNGAGTMVGALSIKDWPWQFYGQTGGGEDEPVHDFGTHGVGRVAEHTFWVMNTGAAAVTMISAAPLSAPYSFKGGNYPGEGGSCGSELEPGESCTLVITFAPLVADADFASLSLNYAASGVVETVTRSLQGRSTTEPWLVLTDAEFHDASLLHDYGVIGEGQKTTHQFFLHNSGTREAVNLVAEPMILDYLFEGGTYPGQGGTCGTTLAPGASCTLVVAFQPTTTGLRTGLLALDYESAAGLAVVSLGLRGMGTSKATLRLEDGTATNRESGYFDYDTQFVHSRTDHTFIVRNLGAAKAASITAEPLVIPFSFKGGNYPGEGGTCASTLAIGESCSLVVSFSPTEAGTSWGNLQLRYDDGKGPSLTSYALTGVVVAPWPLEP